MGEEQKARDQYWLRSGIFSLAQTVSGQFFGIINFALLVRVLPREVDYGTWVLFGTATTLLELIRNGLIQNALIKFLPPASDEDKPKIISASFTISFILTAFSILLILLFAPYLAKIWEAPIIVELLHLYIPIFIFTGFTTQFNCLEQANFSFKGVAISSTVRNFLFFLYLCYALYFGVKGNLVNLAYVQIVSVLFGAITGWMYAKPYLVISYKIYTEWMKKLFHYGKYVFGNSISGILSGTIDQWMLGGILSPAAAGRFNVAIRIMNFLDMPTSAMSAIVFPQSARRMETEGKDAIKYLYEKSMGAILAILIPGVLFLYFFSGYVLEILAPQYENSVPLLRITLLYCLLIPYGRQFGTIMDSIGKARTTFWIVTITATINLSLNFLFIKKWGVEGAAWATLCSNVIGFAIAQTILRRELRVNLWHTFIYAYRFYPEFWFKYIKKQPVPAKYQ